MAFFFLEYHGILYIALCSDVELLNLSCLGSQALVETVAFQSHPKYMNSMYRVDALKRDQQVCCFRYRQTKANFSSCTRERTKEISGVYGEMLHGHGPEASLEI